MTSAYKRGCPVCRNPQHDTYKPFCSKRCADVDLNRWLNGAYAIPAVEDDDYAIESDSDALTNRGQDG